MARRFVADFAVFGVLVLSILGVRGFFATAATKTGMRT
jgi:hypothetical protein